tara:strand:- start:391 stop:585 length:195 start_codon:yes stop_codon:yes gene_type:complete
VWQKDWMIGCNQSSVKTVLNRKKTNLKHGTREFEFRSFHQTQFKADTLVPNDEGFFTSYSKHGL